MQAERTASRACVHTAAAKRNGCACHTATITVWCCPMTPGKRRTTMLCCRITTVRSISEQIQLVIVHGICGTVGRLKDHRFYRGFFKYCDRKHLHQCVRSEEHTSD